jgi:hypothetical protein
MCIRNTRVYIFSLMLILIFILQNVQTKYDVDTSKPHVMDFIYMRCQNDTPNSVTGLKDIF